MKHSSIFITGFTSLFLSTIIETTPSHAFFNCPGTDYNDQGNKRCLYGAKNSKCEPREKEDSKLEPKEKYNVILDSRADLCMYCQPGTSFNPTQKACTENTPQPS
ncbi:MAG: hypothetical protein IBJ00_05610 [Alphaproteobacteria bacterium]|nr:hypothetical protein [Alphaproteobacteria bacterium]